MDIPESPNASFNEAVRILREYHDVIDLGGYPTLNLENRPKGIRSDREWQQYLHALSSLIVIGHRNNWVRTHVNGRGQAAYYLIDLPERQL